MDLSRGRYHRIFDQYPRLAVHQSRPTTKYRNIKRQHIVRCGNTIKPCFNFCGFCRILVARNFNARLQFADRNCGNMNVPIGNLTEPTKDSTVRTHTS